MPSRHLTIRRLFDEASVDNSCKALASDAGKSCAANILEHLGSVRVSSLTSQDVARYRTRRSLEGSAPGTRNREVGVLRAVLRWGCEAIRDGRRPLVDRAKLPLRWGTEPEYPRERVLTAAEIHHLTRCLTLALSDAWSAGLVWILVLSGARLSEILSAGPEHLTVDDEWGVVHVPATTAKERQQKDLPLVDQALEAARVLARPDHTRVFGRGPSVQADAKRFRRQLERASRRCEIEPVTPHDLRRTCATHALRNGSSLEEVAQLLGHSSLQTTRRYARLEIGRTRRVAGVVSGALSRYDS